MDTSVGAPRPDHRNVRCAKPLQRLFQHTLNRPFIGLALPSGEMRSVILKN
jgi:hypothetical protein